MLDVKLSLLGLAIGSSFDLQRAYQLPIFHELCAEVLFLFAVKK